MRILGIETSCDDTSVALLEASDEGFTVLAEKTASQIDVHKVYGGVVPEVAGREHAVHLFPLLDGVVKSANQKPDVIAVTSGPGLITGLLVGVEAARTLSYLQDIPIVSVNHIAGHIHSVLLTSGTAFVYPVLCLVVSGGHTELLLMKGPAQYERVGATRDDAAGECFDKVGKLLGFDYPGGPKISKQAEGGNANAIAFPRPMIDHENCDFSFAGLKTAVLYHMRDNPTANISDVCASFEQAIVDVLVAKTIRAVKIYAPKTIVLSGGVSANKKLRTVLATATEEMAIPFLFPEMKYCTDNAAMIAAAAYEQAKQKNYTDWTALSADPNWRLATTSNKSDFRT